jgi:Ala-tRNA(Pro) deacylase
MEGAMTKGPMASLMKWLMAEGVDHEVHEHDRSFTAMATARAEGVDPKTFAKVVWVRSAEGGDALLVVDAEDHVDLKKAREALKAGRVKLVPEYEIEMLAPDCEAGAMPAVGALFGLPTYADDAIREDAEISFNAGNHRVAVRVDRAAWEKAANVQYADLALSTWREPAWSRS